MVPEWFKIICLVAFSTALVTFTICVIYCIVRITFFVIQDYMERREVLGIGKRQKHIDQR